MRCQDSAPQSTNLRHPEPRSLQHNVAGIARSSANISLNGNHDLLFLLHVNKSCLSGSDLWFQVSSHHGTKCYGHNLLYHLALPSTCLSSRTLVFSTYNVHLICTSGESLALQSPE